jgi:hypothetical protein
VAKQNLGVLISMDFEVQMGGETRDMFNCEIDVSSEQSTIYASK